MSAATNNSIIAQIRKLADAERTKCKSDPVLLAAYVNQRDEAAFQALVHRHGAMVLNVCRCVLSNENDAEDAFQAAFLILARKAGTIRKADSLGSWLHGVAYRTALRAREQFARRRKREAHAQPREQRDDADDISWREIQLVLHTELNTLAERHRAPLVLCYIQGKTQDEAAALLGMSKATLKIRLEQGRALLRSRLVRAGLGPAALLLAAWPAATASASVPSTLAAAVVHAATAEASAVAPAVMTLVEEVMRATLLTQLKKIATALLLVALVCVGGGTFAWGICASGDGDQTVQPAGEQPKSEAQANQEKITGDAVALLVEQLQRQPVPRPGANGLGLFMMDIARKRVTLIAANVDQENAYCGSPCWSCDGKRILFDVSPGMQFAKTRLQRLEATNLAPALSSFGLGNCPTISPDGKRIAFLLNSGAVAGQEHGIYVMDADGKNRRFLGGYGIPKWAPDGKHVMTVSFANPCRLTLIDAANGAQQKIDVPDHQIYSVPSWSATDTLVAVVRTAEGFSIAQVDVSKPDAGRIKDTLWKRGDGTDIDPVYPVYSPSLRRGIFVGREKMGQTLYSFEPGKVPVRLEPGQFDGKIASLALSPDGHYLLFCSDRK